MKRYEIHNQSVFEKWPIEYKSIQAVVTSPPYWSLRKYDIPDIIIGGDKGCIHEWGNIKNKNLNLQAGNSEFKRAWREEATQTINNGSFCFCGAWKGQYGLEPTFKLYLEHTMLWIKESMRVLKDDGILFVNIADSYNGSKIGNTNNKQKDGINCNNIVKRNQDCPHKSKCLIPERLAIMCVDELGLILRNHIVWAKPNGMPESVIDRFSKKWESVFMFTKKSEYYFDLDSVRETYQQTSIERSLRGSSGSHKYSQGDSLSPAASMHKEKDIKGGLHENGKNPGDVWNISPSPSSEKHFAMWPEKLVERMILCSTRKDDVVLDPFCGSCTTGRVAIKYQRNFIGIDLGYIKMQERRMNNIQVNLL